MDTPKKFSLALGITTYEGRPCPKGHTQRYAKTGKCVECKRERDRNRPPRDTREAKRAYRQKNRERLRELNRKWRAANPEKVREIKRRQYARVGLTEQGRQRRREYYLQNRDKFIARALARKKARRAAMTPEQRRALRRAEYHRNPEPYIRRALQRKGKITSSQRCACCTPKQVRDIYKTAKMLGCEVDHRTPLCVGGMHCAKNLQVLTVEEHREKTRRDMAEYGWML